MELSALCSRPRLVNVLLYMCVCETLQVNIPKKKAGASAITKGHEKFYNACYSAVLRHVNFDVVKVCH